MRQCFRESLLFHLNGICNLYHRHYLKINNFFAVHIKKCACAVLFIVPWGVKRTIPSQNNSTFPCTIHHFFSLLLELKTRIFSIQYVAKQEPPLLIRKRCQASRYHLRIIDSSLPFFFISSFLGDPGLSSIRVLKDGAYYCYYGYVLRISRYSDFLSPMLTNTENFLRGLNLSGESRS